MTNAFSLFRALAIYGICLPLAIFLGYLLATPDDMGTEFTIGVVATALTIPIFLRWHHPFLVLAWNMGAVMFFLPGRPAIFLPACLISFTISILQYTLNRNLKFTNVPAVTWPLLALVGVALVTAHFTGGIGLKVTGSASYGGKRYLSITAAVAGYFALTAKRVPVAQAPLYVKLYLLSGLSSMIAGLSNVVGSGFYWIFLMFPGDPMGFQAASTSVIGDLGGGILRMGWLSSACGPVVASLLAFYGLSGILDLRHPWRLILFVLFAGASLLGGFHSILIAFMVTLLLQFYFEGLFRSRVLPAFILMAILGSAMILPFTNKLPLSVQRAISFLPVDIDPTAAMDAEGSTEWRLLMWQRALPEVPNHLLLGKGYAIDPSALEMANLQNMRVMMDPYEGAFMAGDYHSGPLSVILTFGLGGTLAFLWFLYGATKTLYHYYANGSPELKKINTYLLVAFITKIFMFFFIFGSLYSDILSFAGLIGLGISLNGAVHVPAPAPVARQVFHRFRLANAPR